MSEKNFYELDYIIEIDEKRLEQYTSSYQKVLERLTHIILIYSALTIFLIPIVQDISNAEIHSWMMITAFISFCILFIISLIFTVRLIISIEVAYLEIPKKYYEDYRIEYEQTHTDKDEISKLLKASYITELEAALVTNDSVFRRKSSFYYNALMFGLLSVAPYLICLGFHISKREDNIQKVQIINPDISSNLHQIDSMAKDASTNNSSDTSAIANGAGTKLPGVNNSQVISSKPMLIRENSQNSSSKKDKL